MGWSNPPMQPGALSFLPNEVLTNPTTKTYFTTRGRIPARSPLGRTFSMTIRGLYTIPAMVLPTMTLSVDAVPTTGSPIALLSSGSNGLLAAGTTLGFSLNADLQIASGAGTAACGLSCTGTFLIMTNTGNDDPKVVDGGTIMIDNTQDNALCFGVLGNSNAARTFTLRLLRQSPIDLQTA